MSNYFYNDSIPPVGGGTQDDDDHDGDDDRRGVVVDDDNEEYSDVYDDDDDDDDDECVAIPLEVDVDDHGGCSNNAATLMPCDEIDGIFIDNVGSDSGRHIIYSNRKKNRRCGFVQVLTVTCFVVALMVLAIWRNKKNDGTHHISSDNQQVLQEAPSSSSSEEEESSMPADLPKDFKAAFSYEELLLCGGPPTTVVCKGDRIGHNDKLYVRQAICNDVYRFGVIRPYSTFLTSLVWQDCSEGTTYYLQNVTLSQNNDDQSVAFQLTEHGVFELWEVTIHKGQVINEENQSKLWELPSIYTSDIQPTERCLKDHPIMDCPYLHLRKNGGNIVLNYIKNSTWMAKPIQKAFPTLFPDSFNP